MKEKQTQPSKLIEHAEESKACVDQSIEAAQAAQETLRRIGEQQERQYQERMSRLLGRRQNT